MRVRRPTHHNTRRNRSNRRQNVHTGKKESPPIHPETTMPEKTRAYYTQMVEEARSCEFGKIIPHVSGAGTVLSKSKLRERLLRPQLVMCGAEYAGIRISEEENAFTKLILKERNIESRLNDYTALPETHIEGVLSLAATYIHNGHKVKILPSQEGSPDAQYSTDQDKTFQAANPLGNDIQVEEEKYILENIVSIQPLMTHKERQQEIDHKRKYLKSLHLLNNPKELHDSPLILQMTKKMEFGDTRVCMKGGPNFIMAGIAESNDTAKGRSTKEGHAEFQEIIENYVDPNIIVCPFDLKQPFYHFDTVGPVTHGPNGPMIFTTKEAFTEESWGKLENVMGTENIVILPYDDIAKAFGGNATEFGGNIYISNKISDKTIGEFTSRGFNIHLTDISNTMLTGGGHRCMTSVHHLFVPGGFPENLADIIGLGQRQGKVFETIFNKQEQKFFLYEKNSKGKLTNEQDITGDLLESRAVGPIR